MESWTLVEYGFDSGNETVNFGTRTLAEDDALYETTTLAVVSTESQVDKNPSVQCFHQHNKVYLAIDSTLRVFSNNCSDLDLFTSFGSSVDSFNISLDGHLVVVCLHDGNIHCLHVPSGGRLVCSSFVAFENEKISFSSMFSVNDDSDAVSFLMYTTNGNMYRLKIDNIAEVYKDLNNDVENLNIKFEFEDFGNVGKNSEIIKIKYEDNLFYTSNVFKRCFAECGACIIALNKGSIIAVCKLTNMIFDLWSDDVLQDLMFLRGADSNDHRILVITDSNLKDHSYIKLLSYPTFDTIYNLKVSKNTYLVESSYEQDEVLFIEGVCARGSQYVNELRLKVITESIPEVKLQRMLRRKCFEEAKKFASLFRLGLQSVYKAEAEEYIIKSNFRISDIEDLCKILDNIEDIQFIVQYCLEITSDTLEGIEIILEYANKKLHVALQNNPDNEVLLELKSTILKSLYRLDTFKILNCENGDLNSAELISRWAEFSCADLLEEMQNYLKNGNVDKCTLLFNRLQEEHELDAEILANILKTIPTQIALIQLLPLLRHILMYSLESVPAFIPNFISWIQSTVFIYELTDKTNWLEYTLNFTKQIQQFFYSNETSNLFFQQHLLSDGCLSHFRDLINSLDEMMVLKLNFGIDLSLEEYMQEPNTVVHTLLDRVTLNQIPDFINDILGKYSCTHKLNLDFILSKFIKEVSDDQQNCWEEKVVSLIPFIYANTLRMETILLVLEMADVPWSNTIKSLAKSAANESHPLAANVKVQENNISWKMLLKKYSISEKTNYDNDDVLLIMRRILHVAKPEMLSDLQVIVSRNLFVKEKGIVICFNHFIQKGDTGEALKYLINADRNTIIRCCKSVLYNLQYFMFSGLPVSGVINNYMEVLSSILERFKSVLPEYEFTIYQSEIRKLQNINLLREKYNCIEISTPNFDLTTLLPKLVNEIVTSVNENKITWSEATRKCERLSILIGVSKEECLFELANQSGNLTGLIHAAESMIKCDCKTIDMCSMAVFIMKNIDNNQISESENSNTPFELNSDFIIPHNNHGSEVVKALKLANNLALRACVKADQLELNTACEILNWSNVCFWLRNEPIELLPKWRFTPLFHPENICSPSARTVATIRELFQMFLNIAGNRIALPSLKSRHDDLDIDNFENKVLQSLDLLPEKIQQLHIEGYDLTIYQMLNVFKMELVNISTNLEFSMKARHKINYLLTTRCITQLLHKIFVSKKIDQQLAFALFLTPGFQPLKWIHTALKMYKSDVKKLNALATLTCRYMEVRGISGEAYDTYLNLKNLCDWWLKFLHHCVSYNDTFQLNPDKIMKKYLLRSEKFSLKLLREFCSDFKLDVQSFLPLYLRYTLLQWKQQIEFVKDPTLQNNMRVNDSENELFKKCKEIISSMENKSLAVEQLNAAWNEVSYYQYEAYLCILDLLEFLDQASTNPQQRFLLLFLKSYTRIKKPQTKEREEWQTKYPFTRNIDPLSDYRLPFLMAIFIKDIWEIIRPEINLLTYERWFQASSILQLPKNDICTFAVKGTIHSGVLKCSETRWSVISKHDNLLSKMESCVSQISNLELATAVLYQAVCSVSGGADQVSVAKMCWQKAQQWKKSTGQSELKNEVWVKVKLKYFKCLSMHILHTNDLGITKYLSLVEQTEELIRALYQDDSIIQRTKGVISRYPNINNAVDELGEFLGVDVAQIRKSLIMEYLQEPCNNVDFDESFYSFQRKQTKSPEHETENLSDNLKRVIYICESIQSVVWKELLFNICASKLDETISMFAISPDLSMRLKALQCLFVVCEAVELEDFTGQPVSCYLEKLKILLTLETIGYSLTVEQLDICNKIDLAWKILRSNSVDKKTVKAIAQLCALYGIWDSNLWDKILQNFVLLVMVTELKEWLPKLYRVCYTPGIKCNFVSAWECLVNNCFLKTVHEDDFVQGFLLIQICPIISQLDSCLINISNYYLSKTKFEVCAMLLPYIQKALSRKKIVEDLKPYKNFELFEKIRDFSQQGVLNTDYAISILRNN